jgi:hypothetical protein
MLGTRNSSRRRISHSNSVTLQLFSAHLYYLATIMHSASVLSFAHCHSLSRSLSLFSLTSSIFHADVLHFLSFSVYPFLSLSLSLSFSLYACLSLSQFHCLSPANKDPIVPSTAVSFIFSSSLSSNTLIISCSGYCE